MTPVKFFSSFKKGKMFLALLASIFLPFPPLKSLKVGTLVFYLLLTPNLSFLPFSSADFKSSKYLVTSSSALGD
jgi:hypothetical protein